MDDQAAVENPQEGREIARNRQEMARDRRQEMKDRVRAAWGLPNRHNRVNRVQQPQPMHQHGGEEGKEEEEETTVESEDEEGEEQSIGDSEKDEEKHSMDEEEGDEHDNEQQQGGDDPDVEEESDLEEEEEMEEEEFAEALVGKDDEGQAVVENRATWKDTCANAWTQIKAFIHAFTISYWGLFLTCYCGVVVMMVFLHYVLPERPLRPFMPETFCSPLAVLCKIKEWNALMLHYTVLQYVEFMYCIYDNLHAHDYCCFEKVSEFDPNIICFGEFVFRPEQCHL